MLENYKDFSSWDGLVQFPIYGVDHFLNNETIVEQDLVAWVSMGIIHVPRAEASFLQLFISCVPSLSVQDKSQEQNFLMSKSMLAVFCVNLFLMIR